MRTTGFVMAVLLVVSGQAWGQSNAWTAARQAYDAKCAAAITNQNQIEHDILLQYKKAVSDLLAVRTQQGDYDAVVALTAENKRLAAATAVPQDVPDLLRPVAAACQKRIASAQQNYTAAVVAYTVAYRQQLETGIKQVVRAGQLEQATGMKTEIADLNKVLRALGYSETNGVKAVTAGRQVLIPAKAKAFNGHHYLHVGGHTLWHDAKKACETQGGHLVTITSSAENEFVYGLIGSNALAWMGCSDEAEEGAWVWVTGEPMTYVHWSPGEPNGGRRENFMLYRNDGKGEWFNCFDAAVGYVCEWDR